MSNTKIAICFFGITRSLTYTIKSINDNVIGPAKELGDVKVFCHFFDQKSIYNPRSNECLDLNTNEYELLFADEVELEEPDTFISDSDFNDVCKYGDSFEDGFISNKNLFHQLWSLNKVTNRALNWQPEIVVFVRPDLLYFDSFIDVLTKAVNKDSTCVYLPNWQHCGGVNDRFAIARGEEAIKSYGQRYHSIMDYCSTTGKPLHSERLLKFSLKSIPLKLISHRASRIRANSSKKPEIFHHYKVIALGDRIAGLFKLNPSNKLLTKFLWAVQRAFYGNPYKY